MHTGSSGGAVGAWRASSSGLMISVTAYSEIAAHDHRNYPEAVNANPAELRGGDFNPRKFRVRYTNDVASAAFTLCHAASSVQGRLNTCCVRI
jgi:RES domain-containing protein